MALSPDELSRARAITQRLAPDLDWESIAADAWIESWQLGYSRIPYVLLRHRVHDRLRSRRREALALMAVPQPSVGSHLPPASETELVEALFSETDLTLVERNVLYLRFWKGMGFLPIATSLNLSPEVVHDAYHRAMGRLYVQAVLIKERTQ